jgi:hypothetical protein
MAVTVTPIPNRGSDGLLRSFDVTATADADVAAVILHGLPFDDAADANERGYAEILPQQVESYVSTPVIPVVTALNANVTMSAAVGSGVAGSQFRVQVVLKGWGY